MGVLPSMLRQGGQALESQKYEGPTIEHTPLIENIYSGQTGSEGHHTVEDNQARCLTNISTLRIHD